MVNLLEFSALEHFPHAMALLGNAEPWNSPWARSWLDPPDVLSFGFQAVSRAWDPPSHGVPPAPDTICCFPGRTFRGRISTREISLTNLQLQDSAVFQCEATNKHGTILASANVNVLSECLGCPLTEITATSHTPQQLLPS